MYRVRTGITGSQGGQLLSTQYFNVIGGLTAADAVADLHTFWTAIRNYVANDLTFQIEAEVAQVDIGTGEVTGIVPVTSSAVTGNEANDPEPWATQGLVRLRSGVYVAGREVRGRIFIPGPTYVQSSGGQPSSTYRTAIDAAMTTLLASANSELMVYSRKHRDAVPVLSATTWNQWAVLRSRRL